MRKDFKFLFWSTLAVYALLLLLKSVNFKGWSNFLVEPLIFSVLWFFLATGFDLILLKFIPELHEALFYEAPLSKALPQRNPPSVFKENSEPSFEKVADTFEGAQTEEKKAFTTSAAAPLSTEPPSQAEEKINGYQVKKEEENTELEKAVLEYDDKALARATSSFIKED